MMKQRNRFYDRHVSKFKKKNTIKFLLYQHKKVLDWNFWMVEDVIKDIKLKML